MMSSPLFDVVPSGNGKFWIAMGALPVATIDTFVTNDITMLGDYGSDARIVASAHRVLRNFSRRGNDDFKFENTPDDCSLCNGSGIAPSGDKSCYACNGSGYATPFNVEVETHEPTFNVTPRLDADGGGYWIDMGGDIIAHINSDGEVVMKNEYMSSNAVTIAAYKTWSNFLVKTINSLREPKIEVLPIVDTYAGRTREFRWEVKMPTFRSVQFGYEPDARSARQAAQDWINEVKSGTVSIEHLIN